MVLAVVGGLIWALAGMTFAYNVGNDSASQVILFSVHFDGDFCILAGLCLLVAESRCLYALFNHAFGVAPGVYFRLVPSGDCRSFDYRCGFYVLFRPAL